jgi:hypothetical protein
VTGTYVQWGWGGNTDNSGWIAGTVTDTTFGGQYNDWADSPGGFGSGSPGSVTWTLDDGGASFTGNEKSGAFVWCGSRTGRPLQAGCGWSGTFETSDGGPFALTQQADEVQGFATAGCAGVAGTVYNGPLGLTCDGLILSSAGAQSRFSWALDSATETQFSGNELSLGTSTPAPFCGFRQATGAFPASCFGGGGPMDGLWLTNLGMLTIDQPVSATTPFAEQYASVNWVPWGTDGGFGAQYANIDGVSSEFASFNYAQLVSGTIGWFDSSPTSGGQNLAVTFDATGLTISGEGNDTNANPPDGSLLCGVIYSPDPNGNFADPVGTLPTGCGMTNHWFLWGPTAVPALSNVLLTQHRDQLSGHGGTVVGVAAATVANGGVYFAGNSSGLDFTWYPDPQDQTFEGDNLADAGWCGSSISNFVEPSPCFE